MAATKKHNPRAGASSQSVLKRRLAGLKRRWYAGMLAPSEALQLCLDSDLPRHKWPRWIEPAILKFSSVETQPALPTESARRLTRPEQTRMLATMADKLVDRYKASAPDAACAAIEVMREQGWEHGDKVVARVKREMSKLAKDVDGRALNYSPYLDMRASLKLAEQGKKAR